MYLTGSQVTAGDGVGLSWVSWHYLEGRLALHEGIPIVLQEGVPTALGTDCSLRIVTGVNHGVIG